MSSKRRAFVLAIGMTASTVVMLGFWILNRAIYLIGLSTVITDAKTAPEGLIDLLLLIGSFNHWILGALALAAIGLQFWLVYQIFKYMEDAKALHAEMKTHGLHIAQMRSHIAMFTGRFEDLVKFATNSAANAIRIQSELCDIWPEMKRLFQIQDGLRLKDNKPPIDGWDVWNQKSLAFQSEFAQLKENITSGLIGTMEWRKFSMLSLDPAKINNAKLYFGDVWAHPYCEFIKSADLFVTTMETINRKSDLATIVNPLIDSNAIKPHGG